MFKYDGVIFVFAGGENVVNNLYLYKGSEIFGVVVGKNTLNEVAKVLGNLEEEDMIPTCFR